MYMYKGTRYTVHVQYRYNQGVLLTLGTIIVNIRVTVCIYIIIHVFIIIILLNTKDNSETEISIQN